MSYPTANFTFQSNYEVEAAKPLDNRFVTPQFSHLTSNPWTPYVGMLCYVTEDTDASKRGLYVLTASPSTTEGNWQKVGSDLTVSDLYTLLGVDENSTDGDFLRKDGTFATIDLSSYSNTTAMNTAISTALSSYSDTAAMNTAISTALGNQTALTFGISSGDILKCGSFIVDNDFLRINGTQLEGRSASQVLSDIGGQASLSFGISSGNVIKCGSSIVDNDFLRVNGTTFEGRNAGELRSDIGVNFGISQNDVIRCGSGIANDDFLRVNGTALEGRSASQVLSDIGAQASLTFGVSNGNVIKCGSNVINNEFLRVVQGGTTLESRSNSEVLSDIGAQASLTFGISSGNVIKCGSGISDNDFLRINGTQLEGLSKEDMKTELVPPLGIALGHVVKCGSGIVDNDFLRINGTLLEGRSASEVLSDIGAISGNSTDELKNKTISGADNTLTDIPQSALSGPKIIACAKINGASGYYDRQTGFTPSSTSGGV
jgi:hypothetical protein